MREVFLIDTTGVDGHAEVGRIRKLDLEDLRFFLGHDDVYHRKVRNGRLMRQLPLLALSILKPAIDLREILILACCQSPVPSSIFLKEDFGGTRRNPAVGMAA